MSNTLLTPTMIARESLRVLHAKLNFIGNINRTYDSRFAQTGAKIGTTFQVRKPNMFTVRTGKTINVQDVVEESVTITCATQQGVDMSFSTAELTMTIDDFRERYIEPAMAQLASTLESQALSMYKDIYQQVSDVGGAITWRDVLQGRAILQNSLAPSDNLRIALLNTQDNLELVDALKGLFNDTTEISKQYKEGFMGKTAGFNFHENVLMPRHTTGTDDGTGDYLTDTPGLTQTGSSIHIDTGTGTFKEGDVVYFADTYRVHPETKANTNKLHMFVVTADYAGGEGDLQISPPVVATGARQNVVSAIADGKAVLKVESDGTTAIGASAAHDISLLFHRDAFAFVSADLELPQGVHFAARAVQDGISMRIVRDYTINNDEIPCRIDVFTGYAVLRPELAVRLAFN